MLTGTVQYYGNTYVAKITPWGRRVRALFTTSGGDQKERCVDVTRVASLSPKSLDELTREHTCWSSFEDMIRSTREGRYRPTFLLRNAEVALLADAYDRTMRDRERSEKRCHRGLVSDWPQDVTTFWRWRYGLRGVIQ